MTGGDANGDARIRSALALDTAPALNLRWDHSRLEALAQVVDRPGIAVFQKDSFRGQLAAAHGDFVEARRVLRHLAHAYWHLYPSNGHFFASLMQLTLAVQNLSLASLFLNDRVGMDDLFVVRFEKIAENPTVNLVSVDREGRCHFPIDPRIPGAEHADYYIGHWLSSAPLWASYRRQSDWSPGKAIMNSGEAAEFAGLAYCGNKPEHFLVPDAHYMAAQGYTEILDRYSLASKPWENRQPTAFWRGATTGIRTGEKSWESLPRIQLCKLSLANGGLLDAGIAKIVQVATDDERRKIVATGLMRDAVAAERFLDFKYQIDIDGNSNAWSGLFQKLATGSPVLKVSSPHGYRQWYYEKLKPWVNMVPVASDMSDLLEKIEWLRGNDSIAQQIGQKGRALAQSLDYKEELGRATRAISAAFRYSERKPEIAVTFDSASTARQELKDGWCEANETGSQIDGSEGRLVLPRPESAGDYVLLLDLSPTPSSHRQSTRRLSIAVNGEVLRQVSIGSRRRVQCFLPRRVMHNSKQLNISILLPENGTSATAATPLDERPLSINLHSLELVSAGAYEVPSESESGGGATGPSPKSLQGAIMSAIYGRDVWHGFVPSRVTPRSIQGWNGRHPILRRLLTELTNKTIVDVGVWKGQSTTYVAEAMRDKNIDGCVIAVDTFHGEEHWDAVGELFDRYPGGRTDVHETFLDNIFLAGLTGLVVPLALPNVAAARLLARKGIRAGMVHLDASREYTRIKSHLEAYWSILDPGGFLVGDDYGPSWPGVVKAAHEFGAAVGQDVIVDGPKWMIKKNP